MKQLTCEMCGSTELIKQDGFFVCQTCGTKYSVEEAKKLMIEGTVKVDNSDKIRNYLELARTANREADHIKSEKYYNLILEEAPNNWEAKLYSVYYAATECSNPNPLTVEKYKAITDSILTNIKKYEPENLHTECVREVAKILPKIYYKVFKDRYRYYGDILIYLGDQLEGKFSNNPDITSKAADIWEEALSEFFNSFDPHGYDDMIDRYSEKIKKYHPTYVPLNSIENYFKEARKERKAFESNQFFSYRKGRRLTTSFEVIRWYEEIFKKMPNSWEAEFYLYFYKFLVSHFLEEISKSLVNLKEIASSVLSNIKACEPENLHTRYVLEVVGNFNKVSPEVAEYIKRDNYVSLVKDASTMLIHWGDQLEEKFSDVSDITSKAADLWEEALTMIFRYNGANIETKTICDILEKYSEKIKKYHPTYIPPNIQSLHSADKDKTTEGSSSSGGCYVATCVYGSYDCPQVWTLRRYRDNTLGSTLYGRLFIRTYYAISPTLVKWFGSTNWFKKLWKGKLDRMVANLNAKGVEDTPYEDRNW